ncbi:MAG: hypothetical protein J2P37_28185 [Ktedonobacteraceae bacterium]|nr:hypothetical protein [Ktedonobacteraceae bacterium]MBO0795904.1 hypothetical protein [Ktedonobacteraceae bacterium]
MIKQPQTQTPRRYAARSLLGVIDHEQRDDVSPSAERTRDLYKRLFSPGLDAMLG